MARFGDALVLVVRPAEHRQQAEEVLEAVEAATDDAVPPGASVAHRLAAVVAAQPESVPPFGAVAPLGDGYVVLLHGPVSAEIASPLGVVRLSGEQAVTWVDHKVEVPLERLSVTSGGHPVQVDPMSDLRAGLVPGSGFVLTPGRAAGQPPLSPSAREVSPSARETAPPAGASTGGRPLSAAALDPTLGDLQPGDDHPREGPAATAGPAPPSARPTEVLSQPVGHLVATDGLRIPLDRAYVLGREPEADPAVTSGSATPVRLADDENLISRVHSYISVEAGQVSVRDAASANGTFVAAPGDEEWARVGEDPVELPPTWSMRVGNQVLTYVSAATGS